MNWYEFLMCEIRVEKGTALRSTQKLDLVLMPTCCTNNLPFPAQMLHGRESCILYCTPYNYSLPQWPRGRSHEMSSNAGIVVSNPTQGMDVCVCVYSVFVLPCL
jgi:hypothetical protein